VFLAALDFAGSLGVVHEADERALLALALVSLLGASGAALGIVLSVAGSHGARVVDRVAGRLGGPDGGRVERWRRRLSPAPIVALLTPAFVAIGYLLFTGGRASTLPARPLLVTASIAVLVGAAFVAHRSTTWISRFARESRARGAVTALLFVGAAMGAWLVSRRLYPGLYEYLHAALAAVAWGCAAFAVLLLRTRPDDATRSIGARSERALYILLIALFGVGLLTSKLAPSVRAALHDVRAPAAHSLSLALAPLRSAGGAPSAEALARARRARAERAASVAAGDLPTWRGAHLLLITIDALRPDHLGLHGYERPTSPYLDELAERSVVFEHAYAQAPHSSYSLATLMTSEYVHERVEIEASLPEETLATVLAGNGYETSAFFTDGIFHTEGERVAGYRASGFGFGRWEPTGEAAAALTDQVLSEIDRIAIADEPPSFVWAHYFDVHEPYRATTFGTSDVDRYDGEIRAVDEAIRRLVSEADERLARELIVVVTSDHGEEFREHGGVYHGSALWEEQIRVPLMVRAPGLGARRVETPVELVDVAPTALAMLDVARAATMRGDDLRALALGRPAEVGPAFAGQGSRRMVVSWPHKLVFDLRFGVAHLYDLARDPHERVNLAGREPQTVDALRGEVHAWIDALATPMGDGAADPVAAALSRGRLGDRRAVEPLAQIVGDTAIDRNARDEAALLLGRIGDVRAREPLAAALETCNAPEECAEIAAALGRLHDPRARDALVTALDHTRDVELRVRIALALGRLEERAGVEALIEATERASTHGDRREAVRALGHIGDARAVEPLLGLLDDFRLRRYAAMALGRIGDARALPALLDHLAREEHATIRDGLVQGLAELGDERALPALVAVARSDTSLQSTPEALVRLGAIERGVVGGKDLGPGAAGIAGFDECVERERNEWSFLGRSSCTTRERAASVALTVPRTGLGAGMIAVLRWRRADAGSAAEVRVTFGSGASRSMFVTGDWTEVRFPVSASARGGTRVTLSIEASRGDARIELDHVLLLPAGTARI
jgi:arylsulfatase A-like enzyme